MAGDEAQLVADIEPVDGTRKAATASPDREKAYLEREFGDDCRHLRTAVRRWL
jgi:hypothetical protein